MSEWGRVALYYDFEQDDEYEGRIRVRGLISKAYKYPGTINMILHAYYGTTFLYWRTGWRHPDFRGEKWENRLSGWRALNTAFDVLFDLGDVDTGVSSVEDVIIGDDMSDEEMAYEIFNCEGTDGFIDIMLTGNPEDGYKIKYAYEYYRGEELNSDKRVIKDFRQALSLDRNAPYYMEKPIVKEAVESAMSGIEKIGELMTEEELLSFEDLGIAWIRDAREARRLELERIAFEEAEKKRIASGLLTDEDPVHYLGIKLRTYHALYKAGIETIGQLRKMSDEQLLACDEMGPKQLEDVKKHLSGLSLNENSDACKLPKRRKQK
ncbi:MAG: hypothetical protein K6B72_12875 [Lachnospiraceae bacterium]|nr:hypothetical protein [Lachnospiraceae bacterium]